MPKQVYYKISKDRQLKLIKPAIKEFLNKSYDKITVQSLTGTMKILRTDFYYYFSDKEDIYEAILDNFFEYVKSVNPNCNFHESLVILFNKLSRLEGTRNKAFLADLTETYDPLFAKELTVRVRKMFNCECTGDKPQVKIRTKIYKFLTVVNLYAKGELSFESAKELIEEK